MHEGLSDPGFTVPDSVETAEICRKSGKLAIPGVCSHDPRAQFFDDALTYNVVWQASRRQSQPSEPGLQQSPQ